VASLLWSCYEEENGTGSDRHTVDMMPAAPSKRCDGCYEATEEEDCTRKRDLEREMDSGLQVQLEEDGDDSAGQCLMETTDGSYKA